jgi:MerC mercury resistance protein
MIQKANSPGSRGDRTGILIASVCFVHCIAGPILLSCAGFASLIGISEKLEPLFLLGSLAMGVATLIPGYRRHHERRSCLAMFCTGIVSLLLRHRIPSRLPIESIGAGILIRGAASFEDRF